MPDGTHTELATDMQTYAIATARVMHLSPVCVQHCTVVALSSQVSTRCQPPLVENPRASLGMHLIPIPSSPSSSPCSFLYSRYPTCGTAPSIGGDDLETAHPLHQRGCAVSSVPLHPFALRGGPLNDLLRAPLLFVARRRFAPSPSERIPAAGRRSHHRRAPFSLGLDRGAVPTQGALATCACAQQLSTYRRGSRLLPLT